MRTKFYFVAALAATMLASCADEQFVGDNSPNELQENAGVGINFGLNVPGRTRADIYGGAAAELLGSNFYVTGTKGTEGTENPTPDLVFDSYLVHWAENTAGQTESNTANWEYVGLTPGISPYANHAKVGTYGAQTIKYWDYNTTQYDFFAFSTGEMNAVKDKAIAAVANDEINITRMAYGTGLASSNVAYTFGIPNENALKNAYITDITEVEKANYGKEVTLKFKNLGSKIRIALYETVPGYSVQAASVTFYKQDGTTEFKDGDSDNTNDEEFKSTTAALISADANGLPTKGTVEVFFPSVGSNNDTNRDYNKASVTVNPVTESSKKTQLFGTLDNKADKDGSETGGALYLGRTLPTATYAGKSAEKYYQTVFPVSSSSALTLRVDYTLVSTDGSNEKITIHGAKAVVPAKFTKWLPNYAYTYIFKISDNTNGWTTETVTGTTPAGLFPITFDAVVAEVTDVDFEQTTITTVATPSITTYQQDHNPNKNGDRVSTDEYDHSTGKKLYVQVMDNNLSPAALVGTGASKLPLLNATQESATPKYHASLLYEVDEADATEAMVMDALENRDAAVADYDKDVTGRNGIKLTYNSNISNTVESIVNGVDNKAITVTEGQAAEINIGSLSAGTYAYVYDYSWKSESSAWTTSTPYNKKEEVTVYEPVTPVSSSAIGSKDKYYSISKGDLSGITPSAVAVTVDKEHLYFSKTNNGESTPTYSYINVDNKIGTTLPIGVIVVAKNDSDKIKEVNGSATPESGKFYFDKYFSNNGSYAVKVIKVI